MLDFSPYKFALPNIISCLSWPPVYLLPGILAGVAINIPSGEITIQFHLLLLCSALLLWLACLLLWRWARSAR
ncbi:DedA family protein, partial [Sodalis-like symbiont of Bactericera trigonica]